MIGSACVMVIAMAILFIRSLTYEPLTVTFLCSTNYNGQRRLVFRGTNRASVTNHYSAYVSTNLSSLHSVFDPGEVYIDFAKGVAGPGEIFTFTLKSAPEDAAWRVIWLYQGDAHPLTRWETVRGRCAGFLFRHSMRGLALHVDIFPAEHYIASSEIKE